MKTKLLTFFACCVISSWAIGGPAEPGKRFQSGASGLGYQWASCVEGDAVRYVVFSHGPRPRELGEGRVNGYVSVSGAGTRNPKATLYWGPRDSRNLFAEPDQLYQVSREGQISTYGEKVTADELKAFIGSQPREYTVDALLAFVQSRRSVER